MRAAVDAAAEGRLPPPPGRPLVTAAAPPPGARGAPPTRRRRGRTRGRGPGPRGGGTADGAGGWLIALEAALALCGAFGCYAVFGGGRAAAAPMILVWLP